jgi:hypothetical protein
MHHLDPLNCIVFMHMQRRGTAKGQQLQDVEDADVTVAPEFSTRPDNELSFPGKAPKPKNLPGGRRCKMMHQNLTRNTAKHRFPRRSLPPISAKPGLTEACSSG